MEPQPYDERDVAVIRAAQGPMEAVERPYDAAAAELEIGVEELLDHLRGMVDRRLLRRVAALLNHRRAGFSANGMGVWKVPEDEILETGERMAAFRGISHCYQRPTYDDWPYSIFTMAHGRSKQECDAILDSIAAECGIGPDDRATLYSSTEYKKIRLRYFTPDYAAWEAAHCDRPGGRSSVRIGSCLPPRPGPRPGPPSSTSAPCGCFRAASTRRCGRCARSAATRSSSTEARAASWSTSTATATSTGSARGGR